MGEWLYYNFAPGSFHTNKLCSRLYSTEIEFYSKNKNSLFSHPLGDLGVTYALHLSSLESPWSTSSFFEGVGQFERKFQTEGHRHHQPLLVSENYRDYAFVWYQNIGSALFGFVIKHACDRTDRQTDRIMTSKTAP